MEENLTKGVCCIPIFDSEKLDSRKCPAEGGVWTPAAFPSCSPTPPSPWRCRLEASMPSCSASQALPAPAPLRSLGSSFPPASCHVQPPQPSTPTQHVGCSWVMAEESRSGVGVGGNVPHGRGEQTPFCLQGQQRTAGRPSAPSEEGGSPGVTPAWGPASSQGSVSSPRGQEHVGSHPLLPLSC